MKLLVPVDGSLHSMEALKVAVDYVKTKGAQVSVISIVPYIGGMEDHEISPARRDRHMESMARMSEEAVKLACVLLDDAGVRDNCVKTVITAISVSDGILDFAEKEGVDLIIMGSRGTSPSIRFDLGSVASQVARYSLCSVYLVKVRRAA